MLANEGARSGDSRVFYGAPVPAEGFPLFLPAQEPQASLIIAAIPLSGSRSRAGPQAVLQPRLTPQKSQQGGGYSSCLAQM